MGGVFGSALLGRSWHGGYAVAADAAGATLLALGLLLLATAALQLGSSLTPFPAPRGGEALTTTGAYGLARHPMYGGGILIALGWTILFASLAGLAFTVVLAVFLDLKARREEAWLCERLPGYEEYLRQIPHKLLPFIY